jgi:flagellar biosynthesis component FlhA
LMWMVVLCCRPCICCRWVAVMGGNAVGTLRQRMAGVAHACTCQHLRGGDGGVAPSVGVSLGAGVVVSAGVAVGDL